MAASKWALAVEEVLLWQTCRILDGYYAETYSIVRSKNSDPFTTIRRILSFTLPIPRLASEITAP